MYPPPLTITKLKTWAILLLCSNYIQSIMMMMMMIRWQLLRVAMMAVAVVAMAARSANGQQPYIENHQLDCYNDAYDSVTKGFVCNGQHSSCTAYLTYRAQPPYTSPNTVGYLLGVESSATRIASINNISSDVASIPTNTQLIVPVSCSCFNSTYYQHNASYTIKDPGETYFTVANLTYQGLTTCQSMISQNPYGDRNLSVGMDLTAPLRCACPTSNQSSLGYKYLLTYMVTWGDTFTSIAQTFGVDEHAVLDANQLQESSLIFPFTTILVPLTTEPTKIQHATAPTSSTPPSTTVVQDNGSNSPSSSNKTPVYIGVAVGAAAVLIILFLVLFRYCRKKGTPKTAAEHTGPNHGNHSSPAEYGSIPVSSDTWSLSGGQGIKYAVESLTVYSFKDLVVATGNFGEEKRIKGTSVYKGNFKGDTAAVKVMKGDVSGEINILKKINHSNIIRLSGFCVHEGNTYLVYEYADKGSLHDWLHGNNQTDRGEHLPWKQRVQIAYDIADGLNYLHNYTTPPYIHKNLKTTNILLDSNFRAKLSNFGLARTLQDSGNGTQLQLTRHVVGTQGYMSPEYIENGVITAKLDVYSFGVILLELLSGREAISVESGKTVGEDDLLSASVIRVLEGDNVRQKLKNFMDSALEDEYPLDLAFSMAELAKSCVAHDPNARPSTSHAFMTLSKILSSSLDWDSSSELHHSNSLSSAR